MIRRHPITSNDIEKAFTSGLLVVDTHYCSINNCVQNLAPSEMISGDFAPYKAECRVNAFSK